MCNDLLLLKITVNDTPYAFLRNHTAGLKFPSQISEEKVSISIPGSSLFASCTASAFILRLKAIINANPTSDTGVVNQWTENTAAHFAFKFQQQLWHSRFASPHGKDSYRDNGFIRRFWQENRRLHVHFWQCAWLAHTTGRWLQRLILFRLRLSNNCYVPHFEQ